MSGPVITVNLKKVEENTRVIVDFCGEHDIDVIGVSKVTCGMPSVAKAMIAGGVKGIGESRIENINRLRTSGINHPVTLLRIPPLSGVDEIVNSVDTSLNSEISVIKELSKAADKKGKVHGVILMLDLGDLREGIWPDDLIHIATEAVKLPGVKLAGLGTNLTCYGGVLPSQKNMQMLVDYAHKIEDTLNVKLDILSGGNSSSLDLVRQGEMPREINQLRIGEAIMLGRETAYGKRWPGTTFNAFTLEAELIEIKKKPSIPIGETGMNAFGGKPVFEDKGEMTRGILNIGREDVDVDGLSPVNSSLSIIGASSDHLLVNITEANKKPSLGDKIGFTLNYGALLAGMTSAYVLKTPLLSKSTFSKNKITMVGSSPVFNTPEIKSRFTSLGVEVTGPLSSSTANIEQAFKNRTVPFIAGPERATLSGIIAMKNALGQSGMIILDSHASLMISKTAKADRKILSTALGLVDKNINMSLEFSPENIVIIGLQEAEKEESDLIRKLNLTVFTMEDIDLLGIREVTRRALRTACSGTHGFYLSFCQDVGDNSSEGLTARELHLAMELISKSEQMRAIDVSGCLKEGQINYTPLIHFVESAFGRRILG
ncbi:MAG: alanine racemase [Spirochaetaceae bacterium]|nr:alanine racemase [Spirochaetaceae bacterium]